MFFFFFTIAICKLPENEFGVGQFYAARVEPETGPTRMAAASLMEESWSVDGCGRGGCTGGGKKEALEGWSGR